MPLFFYGAGCGETAPFCAPSAGPCSDTVGPPASPHASPPPKPVPAASNSPRSRAGEDPHYMRPPFDLLVQSLQHVCGLQMLVMLQRQPVGSKRLFDVIRHPVAQLRILAVPFAHPCRQIAAGLPQDPPVVEPAQLRAAVVGCLLHFRLCAAGGTMMGAGARLHPISCQVDQDSGFRTWVGRCLVRGRRSRTGRSIGE